MKHQDRVFEAQKICSQYMERGDSQLDELRALDREVKRPAILFASCFGILGALLLGSGMSLILTDLPVWLEINRPMFPGMLLGILGITMMAVNFPIYQSILKNRRVQYAAQIQSLSQKIMQG